LLRPRQRGHGDVEDGHTRQPATHQRIHETAISASHVDDSRRIGEARLLQQA
jgi:hypothetical protein